jgi:hypothetical protein
MDMPNTLNIEVKKVEYYQMSYTDLEVLLEDFFGDGQFVELAAEFECVNGTTLYFTVEETPNLDKRLAELKKHKSRFGSIGDPSIAVETVLEYYAVNGHIPFGKYLVCVC